jgi:hypothetical protein
VPFEEVETITRHNAPPQAKLSYMKTGHKDSAGRELKKPTLMITLPTTICGISKSETFRLLIGTGEDAGKVLLRGDLMGHGKGGVKPTQHAHHFKFNFGYVPKLGDDIFDGEHRPVKKISDEEFEIEVPKSWFGND